MYLYFNIPLTSVYNSCIKKKIDLLQGFKWFKIAIMLLCEIKAHYKYNKSSSLKNSKVYIKCQCKYFFSNISYTYLFTYIGTFRIFSKFCISIYYYNKDRYWPYFFLFFIRLVNMYIKSSRQIIIYLAQLYLKIPIKFRYYLFNK